MNRSRGHIAYRSIILIACILAFISGPVLLNAQDRKSQLQEEKDQIEAEIAYTTKLLNETRKSRRNSLDGLSLLQQRIRQRERLMNTISAELVLLENQIKETGDSIFSLSVELKNLKEEYARMIYYANRNRSEYDRLVFIFSAEDFNQAYRRIRYFQQYGTYRRTQAELISSTQDALGLKELELEQQKVQKQALLQSEEEEKERLLLEKQEVNQTLAGLGDQEEELKSSLRKKQQAVEQLDKAIQEIIAEEIRLAEERARAEAASSKTASGFALTPEELELSENFASNRGKLPWPTARGVVSSTFGEHQHPVLPRVKVNNNGIDILTSESEMARAVFNGEVTRVISVPNFNNVVIIRHGEFLSVYSNLDDVLVQKGDKVITKQPIGRVYTDSEENRTEMHFEIWKGKELQNPSYWLSRQK